MIFSPVIDDLINAFRCLPGVGIKSAQRMAFFLLERGRDQGQHLAQSLQQALSNVGHCQQCRTLSETDVCRLCTSPKRDTSLLCIVESPLDVLAIEQSASFNGLYFVLMGHLSPIDGIGPKELGLEELKTRLSQKIVTEVILATNPTVEGEATAHYISELVKPHNIKASRIAHGVPMGGELEYIDSGTLSRAINSREVLMG